MGGELGVISHVGLGSTFYFTVHLPRTEAPTEPLERHDIDLPPGRTILVVDDNVVNQAVAKRMLERWKLRVLIAGDGKQALDVMMGESPDLVLMDVHMPGMDGLEATRQAIAAGFQAPILAMSASVMAEDRAAALAAGMNGFVTKPVRSEDLRSALAARLH
jgi:hypothetical protein